MSSSVVARSTSRLRRFAVVDADHVDADLQRNLDVLFVVDLDEGVEVERLRFEVKLCELVRVQRGDDQEHGVGSEDRRFDQLVGVDDEVLAKDRQVRARDRGQQILDRAAEARRLGYDRQGGGAPALVRGHDLSHIRASADVAGAG